MSPQLSQLRNLLEDKQILIAGYGREGKSSESLLQRLMPGRQFDIACNNEEIKTQLQTKRYDLVIKSPGIPTFVFEGLCALDTITSQTDLFLQVFGPQTIAVTGTKGKTTTTNLIAHLLSQEPGRKVVMAGNMGIPLFDVVDDIDTTTTVVCEFSCHQLENIHRGPHIGVLLNLFQEHLDHYHGYLDYQMAKMQIALKQSADDHFFYCADNADLMDRVGENRAAILSHTHPYRLEEAKKGRWATVPRLLEGDHNLGNIHVASEVARVAGIAEDQIAQGISTFSGLEHRLERVGTYQGITFYNDSICTIPEACMEAVKALHDVDTLILGGFDRGIDYSGLAAFLTSESCEVRNIAFVGNAGARIAELMGDALLRRNVLRENDYNLIVPWCFEVTRQGGICLMSPAAASYDAFKNFEERGRLFKTLVRTHNSK